MNYEALAGLLDPVQFKQMQSVREHLLQDPTAMDTVRPEQENGDGTAQDK